MLTIPFFTALEPSQNILIAGAGGGYDIFSGLPLYWSLRAAGKNVHLANLSFSFLNPLEQKLAPKMVAVTAETQRHTEFFPEQFLAQWFREHEGIEISIYCFEQTGVQPLLRCYQTLSNHLNLDTIILVDGGTDSLMRGDEDGLGTPTEDMTSICAVNQLPIPNKFLLCLGFGVDHYHGVSNHFSFETIADLTKAGGYLGAFSLTQQMPEAQKYQAATEYVFRHMPKLESIVSASILSAISGNFGDIHTLERTKNGKLWINPLMAIYWCFNLTHVANRILYLDAIKHTTEYMEVRAYIQDFRRSLPVLRKRQPLPD